MLRYKSLSVLVVDDELFMLKILSHILGQLGFAAVTTLDNGEDALRLLEAGNAPELVLLDINMPHTDGVEFIRSLVEFGFAGALILVSGETERMLETVVKLARARGLNVLGHLQKPVTPQALEALLASWEISVLRRPMSRPVSAYDPDVLRSAIAAGELVNYYQPKVHVQTGDFVGAEVLVRWRHPAEGLVFPDQFIPLMEKYGLMHELTMAVLHETLCQVRAWADAGILVKPAVNVSMDNLNRLTFPDELAALAAEAGVATSEILLEVTESQVISSIATVLDTLSRLRLKRVALAIDDFGTGHASLAQLSDLPFDQLKIDKRFVQGAHSNATARMIFMASRDLGAQLDMQVVAEGVEDREDWKWLRAVGCDVAQGYFIARPMPAEALPQWLAQWRQRITSEHLLALDFDGHPDGIGD